MKGPFASQNRLEFNLRLRQIIDPLYNTQNSSSDNPLTAADGNHQNRSLDDPLTAAVGNHQNSSLDDPLAAAVDDSPPTTPINQRSAVIEGDTFEENDHGFAADFREKLNSKSPENSSSNNSGDIKINETYDPPASGPTKGIFVIDSNSDQAKSSQSPNNPEEIFKLLLKLPYFSDDDVKYLHEQKQQIIQDDKRKKQEITEIEKKITTAARPKIKTGASPAIIEKAAPFTEQNPQLLPDLQSKLESLKAGYKTPEKRIAELFVNKLKTIKQQSETELENKLGQLVSGFQTAIDSFENKVADFNRRSQEFAKITAELQTQIEQENAARQEAEKQAIKSLETIERNQASLEELQKNLLETQQEYKKLQEQKQRYKEELQSLKEELARKKTDSPEDGEKTAQDKVQKQLLKIEKLGRDISALQEKLASNEDKNDKLVEEGKDKDSKILELEEQIRDLKAQNIRSQSELERLEDRQTKITELERLKEQSEKEKRIFEEKEKELSGQRREITKLTVQIESLEDRHISSEALIATLKERIEILENRTQESDALLKDQEALKLKLQEFLQNKIEGMGEFEDGSITQRSGQRRGLQDDMAILFERLNEKGVNGVLDTLILMIDILEAQKTKAATTENEDKRILDDNLEKLATTLEAAEAALRSAEGRAVAAMAEKQVAEERAAAAEAERQTAEAAIAEVVRAAAAAEAALKKAEERAIAEAARAAERAEAAGAARAAEARAVAARAEAARTAEAAKEAAEAARAAAAAAVVEKQAAEEKATRAAAEAEERVKAAEAAREAAEKRVVEVERRAEAAEAQAGAAAERAAAAEAERTEAERAAAAAEERARREAEARAAAEERVKAAEAVKAEAERQAAQAREAAAEERARAAEAALRAAEARAAAAEGRAAELRKKLQSRQNSQRSQSEGGPSSWVSGASTVPNSNTNTDSQRSENILPISRSPLSSPSQTRAGVKTDENFLNKIQTFLQSQSKPNDLNSNVSRWLLNGDKSAHDQAMQNFFTTNSQLADNCRQNLKKATNHSENIPDGYYFGTGIEVDVSLVRGKIMVKIAQIYNGASIGSDHQGKIIEEIKDGDQFKSMTELYEKSGNLKKFQQKLIQIMRDQDQNSAKIKVKDNDSGTTTELEINKGLFHGKNKKHIDFQTLEQGDQIAQILSKSSTGRVR